MSAIKVMFNNQGQFLSASSCYGANNDYIAMIS